MNNNALISNDIREFSVSRFAFRLPRLPESLLALLALFALGIGAIPAQAGSAVNFTLSLNTAKDPGSTYQNFHRAGAGTGTEFTIGFQIAINSVDGTPVNLSPIAAFCSEIEEPIGAATYTFTAASLRNISAGRAGEAGTASSNIPAGGIGALRAARLSWLFDNFYTSDDLTAWTYTTTQPDTHAFQLATWEVTHDIDLSVMSTGGQIYVGAQSGTNSTLRTNAIALAQSWLDQLSAANVTASYTSTKFDMWALTNTNGNGATGLQDVILATEKNSPNDLVLNPLVVVPEPGTILTSLFGAGLLLKRQMRRKSATKACQGGASRAADLSPHRGDAKARLPVFPAKVHNTL